jgi:DNA invertase Pin-like site-specific DNA recombinase
MSRQTPPAPVGSPTPAAGDDHPAASTQKKYTRRAALYLRVSTNGQTVENQERELRAVAERAGWEITAVYKDEGISGAKGRDKRPALDALLKAATRREFQMVAAWSVDRLGRSLQDLVALLSDLHGVGIDLYLHQQAIDTTTPAGKALFQMMGVFAEFERAMIVDRVKSGMARAKAQGKRFGRPAVPEAVRASIRASLEAGVGINKTARVCGVGTLTVQRIKAEMTVAVQE